MDVGPTLAKGHPRSLDHGCNVRSTCRCSVYPAIHTTTRSLLRSSSTHEPSDPPLRVVLLVVRLHEGDAIIGLRLNNTRESPPIWGRRAAPTEWTFSAPVDGPVRPSVGAPWTRHGAGWHRGSTGSRSPRPSRDGVAHQIGAGRQSGRAGTATESRTFRSRARHPRVDLVVARTEARSR